MKILALRAFQFRRFAAGVSVDGFGPGLNLLAGPNESGKSTLFAALEAVFLTRHTATGSAIEALRPHGGGDPTVEVDFEAAGRRWRLRKRFGRARSALLQDLDTAATVARAQDAEDTIAQMFAQRADLPGRAGLLWVRQRRTLEPPDPDLDSSTKSKSRGEGRALMSVLGSEVVEAAGSGQAETVLARVKNDLDAQVTMRGPKAWSAYAKALEAKQQAHADLTAARSAAQASEARVSRIGALSSQLATLSDGARRATAAQSLRALDDACTQAAGQQATIARLKAEYETLAMRVSAARETARLCQQRRQRLQHIEAALAEARPLQARIAELSAAVNDNGATPQRIARLESAIQSARDMSLALGVASTHVALKLAAGGAGKISADGVAVTADTTIAITQPLTLAVAQAGEIIVTPAGAAQAAAIEKRRKDAVAAREAMLREIGVADEGEARAGAALRQEAVVALDSARLAFARLAPDGLEAMEQEFSRLTEEAASQSSLQESELAEIEVAALSAKQQLDQTASESVTAERYRALVGERDARRRALRAEEEDLQRVREDLARLQGEQSGADEDGRAMDLKQAEGLAERADADVARIEADIAALRLLQETLKGQIEGVRARYLEPVTRALMPYLAVVFPHARVDLGEGFTLTGLLREQGREDLATLSEGTREQLSVLVRLGFARLFADRADPLPLVLDDPLVYSDDARLQAMSRALEQAGEVHQVLVLTCRESAFATLRANRLRLMAWDPA